MKKKVTTDLYLLYGRLGSTAALLLLVLTAAACGRGKVNAAVLVYRNLGGGWQ